MKVLHFIAGLPRAGATMLCNILKQNSDIHANPVSSLSGIVGTFHSNWNSFVPNNEFSDDRAKIGCLKGLLEGYYSHIEAPIIIDKDRQWITQIGLLESVLQKKVKMICMVRNPAEILSSFERLRKENPLFFSLPDQNLREASTIASRAYFYAGPTGPLGLAHANIKDALIMGYVDRLLFVDYSTYCNNPASQTKRIYEFLEIPYFEHDFQNIIQTEIYNDNAVGLKNLHKIKPVVEKTTVNCVEYLGLDLYQQYNREVFWDGLI